MTVRRKLIEVALPLDVINAASVREKSIRHGHPSTLHLWWARRPLAACRAVLFAQLVDDPSSRPEEFPTEAEQDAERERLFGLIGELVQWENSTNEEVLGRARAEILKSTDGNPPPILDPFAGGGSIPLEAQRLGLEAHASDLNPVAVLINKALIEIPPKWAGMPPVHPDAEQRTHWEGAQGLAEDVRLYGKWMRDEAERRIGHLYPKAKLEDGSEVPVIAWIWARTVTCPNPGCGATMPLASSFWLFRKKDRVAWVQPLVDRETKTVSFDIGSSMSGPPDPPKVGRGARFMCLVCEETIDNGYVQSEGLAGRIDSQLMAVVAHGDREKLFLPPSSDRSPNSSRLGEIAVPPGSMPDNPRWFAPPLYGFRDYADLFSERQALVLATVADLVGEARELLTTQASGLCRSDAYADDVAVYLAFVLSRVAARGSTACTWDVNPSGFAPKIRNTFARHALGMSWDYAEANPFSESTANLEDAVGWVAKALERVPAVIGGTALQGDARAVGGMEAVVSTDPPYYDNIGYADLSDFFYVWLRTAIGSSRPDLFSTILTPKTDELIATPVRHGGSKARADDYFEEGFAESFGSILKGQLPRFPMTLFYAFKQSSSDAEDGLGSTGWSTMLEGLLQAGWAVTATWPVRTELANRMNASGTNALASSVVLACRPRPAGAGITDRQGFVRALHDQIPGALRDLQKAYVAPVDLRQAAIGPGMSVFSSYARVVEQDNSPMRVRTALGLINHVLDQVLGEQEAAFDSETRWAVQWFSQFFGDEGPYGTAEQLAVAMNISVGGMVRSGIVESGGGRVRLLGRDEYPDGWDPTVDDRVPVWEACQHLVKRLEDDGEAAAGRLLAELGGLGESAQLLAYRLYTLCERSKPALAGPYNALVASWPEIQSHARTTVAPGREADQLF